MTAVRWGSARHCSHRPTSTLRDEHARRQQAPSGTHNPSSEGFCFNVWTLTLRGFLRRCPRFVAGAAVACSLVWVAGSGPWPVGPLLAGISRVMCRPFAVSGGQLLAVTHSPPGVPADPPGNRHNRRVQSAQRLEQLPLPADPDPECGKPSAATITMGVPGRVHHQHPGHPRRGRPLRLGRHGVLGQWTPLKSGDY